MPRTPRPGVQGPGANFVAERLQLLQVPLRRIFGDVTKDRFPAQLAPRLWTRHQGVRFDLPDAESSDVVLDVGLEVIGMPGVVQASARTRFQVVDPSQPLRFDEVEVEAEAIDDQVIGRPSDRVTKVRKVSAQKSRDVEAAWIVVTAVEEHALLAALLPRCETPHHGGAAVDVRPASGIRERDAIVGADAREQRAQVDLLDQHLDVVGLSLPEADGRVSARKQAHHVDDHPGLALGRRRVDPLQVIELALAVLSADVERQQPALAAVVDQPLRGVEVALGESVLLKEVAPATAADLEIQSLS
jgi:hypothetical protein